MTFPLRKVGPEVKYCRVNFTGESSIHIAIAVLV